LSELYGLASAGLGLASAACWGAGDFCGGLATRGSPPRPVVMASQLVGAALLLALAIGSGEPVPEPHRLALCGAAGLLGVVGLLALYRALAGGAMGVAAPVSGVLCASVPVAAGAWLEGLPGALTLGGFALAIGAVWLVTRTGQGRQVSMSELTLPVVAGLAFGAFVVLMARASGDAVFWPLVAARIVSIAVLGGIAVAARERPWPNRADIVPVALAGVFDAGGNACLVAAAHAGRLDVAGVLSSLYPASTVLLAWWILREPITRWQLAGLAASLAAIAAISAKR
jgi:drug/metabolite transporter (DMT)-like permease